MAYSLDSIFKNMCFPFCGNTTKLSRILKNSSLDYLIININFANMIHLLPVHQSYIISFKIISIFFLFYESSRIIHFMLKDILNH